MVLFTCLSRFALVCSLTLAGVSAVAQDRHNEDATSQRASSSTVKKEKDSSEKKDNDQPLSASAVRNPVLWHQPQQISSLDLLNGAGGKDGQPEAPFVFEDEDTNGTNPKMDVRDASGKKWRVKEGEEARPEVVASRLLWAAGYFVNDDYLVRDAVASGVDVKRGSREFKAGHLVNVRFAHKPEGQKKIGIWEWKQNPFTGTREFNGLRVMMAVMNNWDLKDVNNAVYSDEKTGKQIFLVSDVGATFGSNGVGWTRARSKGNIDSFRGSKFIQRLTDTEVDFSTPKRPTGILLATGGATTKSFAMRSGLDWIGDNVPRADARWMGSLLAQLSHQQLVDAFRAGAFPEEDIADYVEIVESRIAELKKL